MYFSAYLNKFSIRKTYYHCEKLKKFPGLKRYIESYAHYLVTYMCIIFKVVRSSKHTNGGHQQFTSNETGSKSIFVTLN